MPSFTPSDQEEANNLLPTTSDYNIENASAHLSSQPTLQPSYNSFTVAEQEARDGEAVSAMLSTPGGLDDDHFEPPSPIEENINWGLSREGLRRLRVIIKSTETTPGPWPLNASPVFEDLASLGVSDASEAIFTFPQSH